MSLLYNSTQVNNGRIVPFIKMAITSLCALPNEDPNSLILSDQDVVIAQKWGKIILVKAVVIASVSYMMYINCVFTPL